MKINYSLTGPVKKIVDDGISLTFPKVQTVQSSIAAATTVEELKSALTRLLVSVIVVGTAQIGKSDSSTIGLEVL